MAARICPHCKSELTAPIVVAFTNGVDCPKCGTRLEVASGSREISTLAGLIAGAFAWRMASGSMTDLGGVLPTLYAFLAFGIVSALVMMFTANLRNAPALPARNLSTPAEGMGAARTMAEITRRCTEFRSSEAG